MAAEVNANIPVVVASNCVFKTFRNAFVRQTTSGGNKVWLVNNRSDFPVRQDEDAYQEVVREAEQNETQQYPNGLIVFPSQTMDAMALWLPFRSSGSKDIGGGGLLKWPGYKTLGLDVLCNTFHSQGVAGGKLLRSAYGILYYAAADQGLYLLLADSTIVSNGSNEADVMGIRQPMAAVVLRLCTCSRKPAAATLEIKKQSFGIKFSVWLPGNGNTEPVQYAPVELKNPLYDDFVPKAIRIDKNLPKPKAAAAAEGGMDVDEEAAAAAAPPKPPAKKQPKPKNEAEKVPSYTSVIVECNFHVGDTGQRYTFKATDAEKQSNEDTSHLKDREQLNGGFVVSEVDDSSEPSTSAAQPTRKLYLTQTSGEEPPLTTIITLPEGMRVNREGNSIIHLADSVLVTTATKIKKRRSFLTIGLVRGEDEHFLLFVVRNQFNQQDQLLWAIQTAPEALLEYAPKLYKDTKKNVFHLGYYDDATGELKALLINQCLVDTTPKEDRYVEKVAKVKKDVQHAVRNAILEREAFEFQKQAHTNECAFPVSVIRDEEEEEKEEDEEVVILENAPSKSREDAALQYALSQLWVVKKDAEEVSNTCQAMRILDFCMVSTTMAAALGMRSNDSFTIRTIKVDGSVREYTFACQPSPMTASGPASITAYEELGVFIVLLQRTLYVITVDDGKAAARIVTSSDVTQAVVSYAFEHVQTESKQGRLPNGKTQTFKAKDQLRVVYTAGDAAMVTKTIDTTTWKVKDGKPVANKNYVFVQGYELLSNGKERPFIVRETVKPQERTWCCARACVRVHEADQGFTTYLAKVDAHPAPYDEEHDYLKVRVFSTYKTERRRGIANIDIKHKRGDQDFINIASVNVRLVMTKNLDAPPMAMIEVFDISGHIDLYAVKPSVAKTVHIGTCTKEEIMDKVRRTLGATAVYAFKYDKAAAGEFVICTMDTFDKAFEDYQKPARQVAGDEDEGEEDEDGEEAVDADAAEDEDEEEEDEDEEAAPVDVDAKKKVNPAGGGAPFVPFAGEDLWEDSWIPSP